MKKLLTLTLFASLCLSSMADNFLHVVPKNIIPSSTTEDARYFSIEMNNDETFVGLSFDIYLPAGIILDENMGIELSEDRFPYHGTQNKQWDHTISTSWHESDGFYRITIVDYTDNSPIKGTEGELLRFYYLSDEELPCGELPVTISNVLLGYANAKGVKAQDDNSYLYTSAAEVDYNFALPEGWNWISSNLSQATLSDPLLFISPIKDDVERFVSQTHEIVRDKEFGLVGNLQQIEPQQGYKLKVSKTTALPMMGSVYMPSTVEITLQKGWNWIGYLPSVSMTPADALAALSPMDNDIICGQNGFSTYANGEWVGSLTTMTPGEGFLYKSGKEQTFKYSSSSINAAKVSAMEYGESHTTESGTPWTFNAHKYPGTMSVIAQIMHGNKQANASAYTIGAFCGDECRGIGKNVADRIFLTVYGESSQDVITFRAFDIATGNQLSIEETLPYCSNSVGTFNEPFCLNLGTITKIESKENGKVSIVHNPVHNILYLSGNTGNINRLRLISPSGIVLKEYEGYQNNGINVSHLPAGNYIVGITIGEYTTYLHFLKAK